MVQLILAFAFAFNFLETGLGIGTNLPVGNLERFFSPSASGSIYIAKKLPAGKLNLNYENSSFSGIGQPTYQLQLNQLTIEYSYPLFHRHKWSIPIHFGIGNIWLNRKLLLATEKGVIQKGELGVGSFENFGQTNFGAKFSLVGLYNLTERNSSAYFINLKITLGYEF
ncbi:MAG: hypothetical protein ABIK93_07500 [candidate division WOR-3 bacterium]